MTQKTGEEMQDKKQPDRIESESALKELGLENRKPTFGEKAFSTSVYQGVGWGVNEVGSMGFTGMFERGNNKIFGRERFESLSAKLAEHFTVIKKYLGKEEMTHEGGKKLLMWISLNAVGCLVVPAIKVLDSHKAGIVKKLNHWFGSKGMSSEQIEARDKEVELAIACEPTQTWTTLIIGRLAAMTAAIGLGYGILGEKGNKGLTKGADAALSFLPEKFAGNTWLGKKVRATPNYIENINAKATDVNAFHYYAGLVGPETLGCAVSSTVLEHVSKYSAKKFPHVKNPELCTAALKEAQNKRHTDKINKKESFSERVTTEEPALQHTL